MLGGWDASTQMDGTKRSKFMGPIPWRIAMVATALCVVVLLIEVLGGEGLLSLILLVMMAGIFFCWIIVIIGSLIMRRWRWVLWIIVIGLVQTCVFWFGVRNGDEIHFQIMRPIYLMEIARDKSHPKTMDWDWGGVENVEDTLVYVNGVSIATVESDDNQNGAKDTVTRLSKHFFVIDSVW